MHDLDPTTSAHERPAEDTTSDLVTPMRWFARAFGIAVVAHLAGNRAGWRPGDESWPTALVAVSAVLGALALVLVAAPRRRLLGGTAVLVLVSAWLELPEMGNHWLLVTFVALAVLVSLARDDSWAWLAVTGRWVLLAFYSFAAFAKVNEGFMDPTVSCGVFYANQSLASFGLPTFSTGGVLGALAVAGPVLVELSVPILLLVRRTRTAGVLLALGFHTLISLDFAQHFYDFTAALMMLLLLFAPDDTTADLERRAARASLARSLMLVLAATVVAASVLPLSVTTVVIVRVFGFGLWVAYAAWLIVRVARHGLATTATPMRAGSVATWLIVAGVVANGLTPYLELKTGMGFNMYANLRTVAGESNHLVVRRTMHLSHVQDRLLEVVESDDEGLALYADEGYLIPERNLLDYLARHPSATVVVRDNGAERLLDTSDGEQMSVLETKLQLFRAVDTQDPPRCQPVWLPAR